MYESPSQHICPKTYQEEFTKKRGKNPPCSNSRKLESSKIPSLMDPGEAIAGDSKITLLQVSQIQSGLLIQPVLVQLQWYLMDTVLLPREKSIKDRASQASRRLPVTAWLCCMVLVPLSHQQESLGCFSKIWERDSCVKQLHST